MSKQLWHWFRTLQRKQYAAIRTKAKSNVRHIFLGGKVFDTKCGGRNNKNCGLKGLANFEIAKTLIFVNIDLYPLN